MNKNITKKFSVLMLLMVMLINIALPLTFAWEATSSGGEVKIIGCGVDKDQDCGKIGDDFELNNNLLEWKSNPEGGYLCNNLYKDDSNQQVMCQSAYPYQEAKGFSRMILDLWAGTGYAFLIAAKIGIAAWVSIKTIIKVYKAYNIATDKESDGGEMISRKEWASILTPLVFGAVIIVVVFMVEPIITMVVSAFL